MIESMARIFIVMSGVLGFTGVALGAFGAHGLQARLQALPDGVKRMEWWNTAAHYHLVHAVALAIAAWLAHRGGGAAAGVAGWAFVGGVTLFSGSLYLMTVTGQTKLGAITPVGGLLFMVGWAAIAFAGLRLGPGD